MTKDPYKLLRYTLPPEAPEFYAERAVAILRDIKTQLPDFYKHFIAPSEVLTLSGVRAFDTYYELSEAASKDSISVLKKLLQTQGVLFIEDCIPIIGMPSTEHEYSIVHVAALGDLPNRYAKVPMWYPFDVEKMENESDFYLWWCAWNQRIGFAKPDESNLPAEWLDSMSAVHNITFGMLLGYPGEAICSLVVSELFSKQTGAERSLSNADIAHMKEFDGAWPQYDFETTLKDHPNIVAHQKLWSDILNQVYAELEP